MALQRLCLSVIVESFERFSTAFSTSKDENLKQKFEFLQRVYSWPLVSQVLRRWGIRERYTELLINKYLEFLDTHWFIYCPWKTVVARMAEVGPNIKKMYFSACTVDRPWQEIFCHLPNLEVMHFRHNCVDEILSGIAQFCPNILEIDIRHSSSITEEGLKHLCEKENGEVSCPELKRLFLESCQVTEEVAEHLLKGLPSLEGFHPRLTWVPAVSC